MVKVSSLFLAFCLTALLLNGCDKDEKTKSPESVSMMAHEDSVDAAAGVKSVTIYATSAWSASTTDGWITSIDPSSSNERGIFAVHLTYQENTTGEERVGEVVFKAGSYSETYTLTQKK